MANKEVTRVVDDLTTVLIGKTNRLVRIALANLVAKWIVHQRVTTGMLPGELIKEFVNDVQTRLREKQ